MSSIKIGVAMGSGAARGWSHIGVLKQLHAMGVKPDIVCGASIGAVVGAAYGSGHLATIEDWAISLNKRRMFRLLDFRLRGGGLVGGQRLMNVLLAHIGERNIEDMAIPFAAVATRLADGKEIWLKRGPVVDTVRASMTIPGIFTPVRHNGDWLLDGGMCNPVPVTLCRAMGADVVIAIDLHGDIPGYKPSIPQAHTRRRQSATLLDHVPSNPRHIEREEQLDVLFGSGEQAPSRNSKRPPGLLNAINASLAIMQTRITRSRIGGDPPEILITPRLGDFGWMDFDRAAVAIQEGQAAVERLEPVLEHFLGDRLLNAVKPAPYPQLS